MYLDECPVCGKIFPNYSGIGNRNYCSVACAVGTYDWMEFCIHQHHPDRCIKCKEEKKQKVLENSKNGTNITNQG